MVRVKHGYPALHLPTPSPTDLPWRFPIFNDACVKGSDRPCRGPFAEDSWNRHSEEAQAEAGGSSGSTSCPRRIHTTAHIHPHSR